MKLQFDPNQQFQLEAVAAKILKNSELLSPIIDNSRSECPRFGRT